MSGPAATEEPPATGDLLARLPDDVRRLVAAALEPVAYEFGEALVREGDEADAVLILRSGRARVVRQGPDGEEVPLGSLGPGAVVGELAVLRGHRRSATVRASTPVTADRLPATVLRALVATNHQVAESLETAARRYEIRDLLRLASPLARVSGEAIDDVVARLRPVTVGAGRTLVSAGDPSDALYLVEHGRLVVEVADAGGPRPVAFLRAGDVVGERGVVTATPRDATVRAVDDCRLLRLDAADLGAVAGAHPALGAALAQLAASYDHEALVRIPLDFAGEPLIATSSLDAVPPGAAAGAPEAPLTSGEAAAAAPPTGRRGRRSRRRAVPFVRQIDEADCGVACLRMVGLAHGKRVPHHEARNLLGTGTHGTTAAGLARAGRSLGFETSVKKVSQTALADLPLPAIAHVDGNHWLVLHHVSPTAVTVADPATGVRRMPTDEFQRRWSGFAVLFSPGPAFVRGGARLGAVDWVVPLVRPYARRLAVVVALAVALSALELSLEVVTQIVIDGVVRHGRHATVAPAFAVLGGVVVVLTLGTLFQQLLLLGTAQALDRDSLDLLSGRLLALPLPYFQSRRAGDLQRRMDGLREARALVVDAGALAVALSAQLLAAIALLFFYSWPIALLFCVAMPAYAVVARVTLARLQPVAAAVEQEAGKYASRQVEAVHGIETVKVSAAEDEIRDRLVEAQTQLISRQRRQDRLRAGYAAATQGIGFAVLAAFLALGVHLVQAGTLSIGALVACLTLVALATAPVQLFVSLADHLQHAGVLLDRLQDVFAASPEQDPGGEAAPVAGLSGHITLDAVGVRIGDAALLSDVSVDIPAGTTVAVVGRSGSGKTTLVRCLAGLLAPTSGTIRFDGVDAAKLDRRQLRRQIGVVLQEAFLFSDTVAANIALGSPPDPARVEEAGRLAHAHEFVSRLPLGYETRVGESGLGLSGGQRQRLAIARALYRRPPVLILDEATSALDADSERAVQDGLARALAGRTAIIVAHRISTVRHADRILVLDGGRLVEQGTHDELVARRGLYFLLAGQQLDL